MEGLLSHRVQFIIACLAAASTVYGSLTLVGTVHAAPFASHHNATVSGYAYGYIGAAGWVLEQYHFANHPSGTCDPDDPAGNWPFGTEIEMGEPVTMHDQLNRSYHRYTFYKADRGDPGCGGGWYWADLHFGRYKTYWWHTCYCPGTPNPACEPGWNGVDNCWDATVWGADTHGYTKN